MNQTAGKRVGTPSSRSNFKSSNEAAMPNQPGMFAGSTRRTHAAVTATTFPRPIGRLTRMISSSMAELISRRFGQRKKTPVELMSRVTSVIGKSSGTLPTLRNLSGRRSDARGYSRCSRKTPTACVGIRAKRRIEFVVHRGTTFRDGVRVGAGVEADSDCGILLVSTKCGSETSFCVSGKAILLVAFISTPETPRRASAKPPQEFTHSLNLAQVPKEKEWTVKMPLHAHGVNLWKTCEVSYLQLDSYSTASVLHSVRIRRPSSKLVCQNGASSRCAGPLALFIKFGARFRIVFILPGN
jgi:hypothetical protein